MPIRSRHTLGESRPIAARQFTDREDFIAAFQRALDESRTAEPRVLVYYGVGGIGKTSLRKELAKLATEQERVAAAVLDFETPVYRDMETALFALRKSLLVGSGVHFPTFDIAYAVYWQKSRPQTPMTGENMSLMSDSMVLSDLLAAVGVVPIIGVLPRLPFLFAKGRKALRDWWVKRGSSALQELPTLEPPGIAERLPMFWAADVKDHIERTGERLVLFLDTYEALAGDERSEARSRQRDEWVRETVAQLPEALWVVCGRERLRWEEVDADWRSCLDQHLVGGLSESDAQQFLQSCGIESEVIRQAIVKGSEGVPYYLDIAVDTWLEIGERGRREPEPQDFAHTRLEIFDRFLRHLTQAETETLKVLAVPRHWDYALFGVLVKAFQTGYPLTAYDDLCRFSFINESGHPGTYAMHQLMRQSLQEHASQDLVKRVHRFLFEFYAARLKDIDIRAVRDDQKTTLAEAFHHGRSALPVRELFRWFLGPAERLRQAAHWRLLVPLYEQLVPELERELGPEHSDITECLTNLAELLWHQGRFTEAEPLFRRVLAVNESTLGPEHRNLAVSLSNLAVLLENEGKYADAEPLYRRALAIEEKALGAEHPDLALDMCNLATLLSARGAYAEAESLHRRALAIRERTLGPEHLDVATNLTNLATLLHKQGKYTDAERMNRRALAIREKMLGPEHPDAAANLYSLAVLLYVQGRYAEAEPLNRRALAIWEKTLGPEHRSVGYSLNNLAALLRAQGKYTEAESLCRRALAIREKALGPKHADVAWSLTCLAGILCGQDKHAEAEPLYRRALGIWEGAFGPNHPDVARALLGMGALAHSQGRNNEAEPLLSRALAIREEALGLDHPDVAEVLEEVAKLYVQTGRADEAKRCAERAAAIRMKKR